MNELHEKVGCIHMHSVYSDGSGNIEDIINTGISVGLDYLMFTDHFTLKPIEDGYEGWNDSLLTLFGYEHNDTNDENHYMLFDIDKVMPKDYTAEEYVETAAKKGALGIIAHPDEIRSHLVSYPPYPWTDFDLDGFDSIEIWNQMSHWMEGLTRWNKIWRWMHPRSSMITPTDRILEKWDELNLQRRISGIGGVDAHQFIYKLPIGIKVKIFPYKVLFKTIRTHLLFYEPLNPGDHVVDCKNRFINAIRSARCFISNYKLGDAYGFRFWAEANGKQYNMGQTIKVPEEGVNLQVILPADAVIRFVYNGKRGGRVSGNSASRIVKEPGVYRVEVYQGDKGWIYSNHIRLQKEDSNES